MSNIVVSKSFGWKPHISKSVLRLSLIAAVVLVVITAAFAWWWQLGSKTSDNLVANQVCSKSIIVKASEKINASDLTALAAVASDIKKLDNHQADPNCEFILVQNALARGDTAEAEKQLLLLKNAYKGSYSKAFSAVTLTPDELTNLISDLKKAKAERLEENAQNQEAMSDIDGSADNDFPEASQ